MAHAQHSTPSAEGGKKSSEWFSPGFLLSLAIAVAGALVSIGIVLVGGGREYEALATKRGVTTEIEAAVAPIAPLATEVQRHETRLSVAEEQIRTFGKEVGRLRDSNDKYEALVRALENTQRKEPTK